MSNARRLGLAVVAAGVLVLCKSAAAQEVVVPDDIAKCVWLKISARGTGFEYMADAAGLGAKRSIRADCYLQLVYMAPTADFPQHGSYEGPLLCQTAQGAAPVWEASVMEQSFVGMKLADLNILSADVSLTFKNAGGDVIQGYGTHRIQIKTDPKTGAFKSATFQTLGGEMIGSSMFFDSFMTVVGGYTAKGTTVPVAKVPPEAQALVAGSPCNMQ
jgi:hypothetical protein